MTPSAQGRRYNIILEGLVSVDFPLSFSALQAHSYKISEYERSHSVIHWFPHITRKISSRSAGRPESRIVLHRSLSFHIFHVSFTFSAAQYRLTADL